MAVQTKNPVEKVKDVASSEPVKNIDKQTKPFQRFLTKFNNDGAMTFSGVLAYNLMLAMFPILIALISILGFTLGRLDPGAVAKNSRSNRRHISRCRCGTNCKIGIDATSKKFRHISNSCDPYSRLWWFTPLYCY